MNKICAIKNVLIGNGSPLRESELRKMILDSIITIVNQIVFLNLPETLSKPFLHPFFYSLAKILVH